jgi:hypothetical protein
VFKHQISRIPYNIYIQTKFSRSPLALQYSLNVAILELEAFKKLIVVLKSSR